MAEARDQEQKTSVGSDNLAKAPCNQLLDEIGEVLSEGIEPEGDPQAALHKLSDIIGVYETSPLVDKSEPDPDRPLDEREQAVVDKIRAEQEAAKGLQGTKGDPAEGKR